MRAEFIRKIQKHRVNFYAFYSTKTPIVAKLTKAWEGYKGDSPALYVDKDGFACKSKSRHKTKEILANDLNLAQSHRCCGV